MENYTYKDVLERIQKEERNVELISSNIIDESRRLILVLQDLLNKLKVYVTKYGFSDDDDEIDFFKRIKPEILGKLIYYNKVYRIETLCPVNSGKMYHSYFTTQLSVFKRDYIENISNSDFYRYYSSDRNDKDRMYFKRGNINYHDGLNSFAFELDLEFSTFYDYKVARIIADKLLYTYLMTRINSEEILKISDNSKDLSWTNSQNALIELIYALYISNSISHGKISIRKLASICQELFQTPLNDIHHAFHRMKTRSGTRTVFLDQLKISLEEYMDKDL
ncbi:MAG TPA: RteC domain-containing protein [Moheibacter sp.]|nr:RteC domain-containing protein [Moheibacter sp.]